MRFIGRLVSLMVVLLGLAACKDAPPETAVSYRLPGGTMTALVENGRLTLQDEEGNGRSVAQATAITGLSWFLDGHNLVYVERKTEADSILWLVDVATGKSEQLATFPEPVQAPNVSPDGRFLSLIAGTGAESECAVDRRLLIMALDADRHEAALYETADFVGAPHSDTVAFYPASDGNWTNMTNLSVWYEAKCLPDATGGEEMPLTGGYVFDVGALRAWRMDHSP